MKLDETQHDSYFLTRTVLYEYANIVMSRFIFFFFFHTEVCMRAHPITHAVAEWQSAASGML